MEFWKVGELARRTGLTVRTLHHWDEIGLLSPARRSAAGYRQYGPEDVARLTRILALRQLGLSLEEVRACLDRPGGSLQETLELRAARLREDIARQRRLLARLEGITARLSAAEEISVEDLTQAMEVIAMFEKYYSPEQREQLAARAQQVSAERMRQVESEWREVFDGFRREMEAGSDPAAEGAQAIARKAQGLIGEFTGGDPGITESLGRMYREEGAGNILGRHGFDFEPAVFEYMGQAMAALRGD